MKAWEERLEKSCISKEAAEHAALVPETTIYKGQTYECLTFYYYNPDGTPMLGANGEIFNRRRLLNAPDDVPRYLTNFNERAHAYFPLVKNINWKDINNNVKTSVIITEGEFKALKATLANYPTIGLGGVSSFSNFKKGEKFILDLSNFNWLGRDVYIIYDNDMTTNKHVKLAAHRLCVELTQRGAMPYIIHLPADEDKLGLDDFIIKYGAEAISALLDKAERVSDTKTLLSLNNKFTHVQGIIYEFRTKLSMSKQEFLDGCTEKLLIKTGIDKPQELVSIRKLWLEHQLRATADIRCYKPYAGQYFNTSSIEYLNTWEDSMPKTDAKFDAISSLHKYKPILDYIMHLCNDNDVSYKLLLQWLAYPLQCRTTGLNPKMSICLLLFGPGGTGKSTLGYLMNRVYGEANATTVETKELTSAYNARYAQKQFVFFDEVSDDDKGELTKLFKFITTTKKITVNNKFDKAYTIDNYANYMVSTNSESPLKYDDGVGRRLFALRPVNKKSQEYWETLYNLYIDNDEAVALFYQHLMCLDLTGFAPNMNIHTSDKILTQKNSNGDVGMMIDNMTDDDNTNIYPLKELCELYANANKRMSMIAFKRILTNIPNIVMIETDNSIVGSKVFCLVSRKSIEKHLKAMQNSKSEYAYLNTYFKNNGNGGSF